MRFEDLEVWKRSARLSVDIYRAMQSIKDYGFRDQLTRAGLSMPSNIAESFERESVRKFVNSLSHAKGLCDELRTQIYIGMAIGYIDRETERAWIQESIEISAMLAGLIKTKRAHIADGQSIFNLSPFTSPMNLRSLAETVLPAPLFQRLPASSIAKRLAWGAL